MHLDPVSGKTGNGKSSRLATGYMEGATMSLTPSAVAAEIRYMIRSSVYNSFLDRLADAIEIGEGYVVITLDPDGMKVTPLRVNRTSTTVDLRVRARQLADFAWTAGRKWNVAFPEDGGEDQLPSSMKPSGLPSTPPFDTS